MVNQSRLGMVQHEVKGMVQCVQKRYARLFVELRKMMMIYVMPG